jgi:pimeloyl-ACP methyl ester carboxylesterase
MLVTMRALPWLGAGCLAWVLLLAPPTARAALPFQPCADEQALPQLKGSLCAVHSAPLDPNAAAPAASADQLQLFVRKFPAVDLKANEASRGELWLIAGGPGESGASLLPFVGRLQVLFPGHDLVLPDHRGTGYSSRLCAKEESPDSPGGTALVGAEWGSCFGALIKSPARARQFTISNAARDLRALLQTHSGDKPVLVYAVSYGTQLLLRALHFGPLPVTNLKGVILDSLVPLETDAQWDLSRRSYAVDDVGRQVLTLCDANAACRKKMGESAALSYRRVLDRLDPDTPSNEAHDAAAAAQLLDKVPGKNLPLFMGSLLDWPAARALIPELLHDLEAGQDTAIKAALAEMQKAAALWTDDPQLPASVPLASIISASENNQRPELTVSAVRQAQSRLLFTSSLPELLAQPSLPSYPRDKLFGKQPKPLPPLLIFSGTLDPKTHFEAAGQHVAALRQNGAVTWVAVQGAPHFILWTAPDCFAAQVKRFFGGDRPARADCAASAASLQR